MKTKQDKLVDVEAFIDERYGKEGAKRIRFEEGYEAFKIGVLLQEMRKQKNMTQEDLAKKCGTTKNYISRAENDAGNVSLSKLMRIIHEGFGGQLRLSVSF